MPINRKKQIEEQLLRRLVRQLKVNNVNVTASVRGLLKDELKIAAMIGATEERNRTIEFLLANPASATPKDTYRFIIHRAVLDVLGYTETNNDRQPKG